MDLEVKRQLYSFCQQYVEQKIASAQEAIDNAQSSANKETKSSSGDKYETGRSMMQLEIEKYSSQLNDGITLKKALNNLVLNKNFESVKSGSLVITNHGNYFISISAGKLIVNNIEYMAVSYSSPIGQALFNKRENDEFEFRGKKFKVKLLI